MIIKSITLKNFRNHESHHLELNQDTTLILGENGCGKTSVLEAIYILTRGKSFRATDMEILKRDKDFYCIELEYLNGEKITASFDGKNKTFNIADKKSRRLTKKYKHPIILFLPSDLNLISGSPSRHRDYFDNLFSELSEDYQSTLSRYEKALKQRNELLKNDNLNISSLFSWNLLLAKYGTNIYKYRQNFTKQINEKINKIYHSIAENQDDVFLKYQSEITDVSEDNYLKILEQNIQKDSYLGYTSFGVHRDDFRFIFNNHEADGSASRGETRSIILALKFTEAEIMIDELHEKPIILLDDVFSELDNARRKCLIDNFKNHQVIITSVEAVDDN